jgi:hypothetical protein
MKTKLTLLFFVLTVLCFCSCGVAGGGGSGGSTFAVTLNPSLLPEYTADIAIDSSYIYIVGDDKSLWGAQNDAQWRIEKRTKAAGGLVSGFDTDGILLYNPSNNDDIVTALTVDGDYIYVAGMRMEMVSYRGQIIKVNKNTGAFDNGFGVDEVLEYTGSEQVCFVMVDDDFLYVVDIDNTANYRIVKFDKASGAIIDTFGNNGEVDIDVRELAVDDSYLYAVGDDLYKLNKTSGEPVNAFGNAGVVVTLGSSRALAIDSGYVYVGTANPFPGPWFVEKFDINTGDAVAGFETGGGSAITSGTDITIAVDSDYIYLGGTDRNPPADDWRWCMEKRDIVTGNLVPAFAAGGACFSNPSNDEDYLQAHVIDSGFIYITGIDDNAGDSQWRLEKRDKKKGGL